MPFVPSRFAQLQVLQFRLMQDWWLDILWLCKLNPRFLLFFVHSDISPDIVYVALSTSAAKYIQVSQPLGNGDHTGSVIYFLVLSPSSQALQPLFKTREANWEGKCHVHYVLMESAYAHPHSIHVHNTYEWQTMIQMSRDRANWDDRTTYMLLATGPTKALPLSVGLISIVPSTSPLNWDTAKNRFRISSATSKGRTSIGAMVSNKVGLAVTRRPVRWQLTPFGMLPAMGY